MSEPKLSVFSRLALALVMFRRILTDSRFAGRAAALQADGSTAAPESEVPPLREADPNAGLQLLGLLQKEGRFIDFLEEGVDAHSDAEVGAVARIVHEGCGKVLEQHFTIEAVRAESEGARVTLAEGFDASAVRLTGNVIGRAPFTGSLVHRGWRVKETKLPRIAAGHDLTILAPAEVEL